MTTLACFDTSALAKRYLEGESGADAVNEICSNSETAVVISLLVQTEFAGVASRRARDGRLTAAQAATLRQAFALDVRQSYRVIPTDETVHRRAVSLLEQHEIRTLDALHVSSAIEVGRNWGKYSEILFVTADRRQADAARAEGLAVRFIE